MRLDVVDGETRDVHFFDDALRRCFFGTTEGFYRGDETLVEFGSPSESLGFRRVF